MRCWKCGESIPDNENTCIFCGKEQERGPAYSEVGCALRTLYDRCGSRAVLTRDVDIVNGLGDLMEDSRKIRALFQMAFDAGVGKLYLEQIQSEKQQEKIFYKQVYTLLTKEAGLDGNAAAQMIVWFDEMIGWKYDALKAFKTDPGKDSHNMHGNPQKILGIDLGGSFCRAAVIDCGEPVIVPTAEGGRKHPSTFGCRDGRVILCEEAQKYISVHPEGKVRPFKQMMGSSDEISCGNRSFSPTLLAALLMRRIRKDAEEFLGNHVNKAVVTVPNNFTDAQRQAVLDAGQIAGLDIRRLINTTSAAGLAYGCFHEEAHRIMVCDLGNTGFRASVMEMGDGVAEVLSSAADDRLGCAGYDASIVGWLAKEFMRCEGIDLMADSIASVRLWEAAETAKRELSNTMSTKVFLPCIVLKYGKPLHLDVTLTREVFYELTAPLRRESQELIQRVLNDSYCIPSKTDRNIQRVLLVGGGSHIPAVRDMIRQVMGQDIFLGVEPEECMAVGAAIQAGQLSGELSKNHVLVDVTAYSVGIETKNGNCTKLIARNTAFPTRKTQRFSTNKDNQMSIEIHAVQGEKERAADNISLGSFLLTGIPVAKRGVPRVEVTFDINLNGMTTIYTEDKTTGEIRYLQSDRNIGMSEEELQAAERQAKEIIPID